MTSTRAQLGESGLLAGDDDLLDEDFDDVEGIQLASELRGMFKSRLKEMDAVDEKREEAHKVIRRLFQLCFLRSVTAKIQPLSVALHTLSLTNNASIAHGGCLVEFDTFFLSPMVMIILFSLRLLINAESLYSVKILALESNQFSFCAHYTQCTVTDGSTVVDFDGSSFISLYHIHKTKTTHIHKPSLPDD